MRRPWLRERPEPDLADVAEYVPPPLPDPEEDPDEYLWISDLLTREPPVEEE